MTEILTRVASNGCVELIDDRSQPLNSIACLTPPDAAYLARAILSCAVALSGMEPPKAGTVIGDAHLPIMAWKVGTSAFNGEPVLILSVPSGIELTFQMPKRGATEMGAALVARGQDIEPLGPQSGTIH